MDVHGRRQQDAATAPARLLAEQLSDAAQQISGRKWPIAFESLGLLLAVVVTAASADDGATAPRVLGQPDRRRFPRLEMVWSDGKSRNHALDAWLERGKKPFEVKVVERPKRSEGFVKLWGLGVQTWAARQAQRDPGSAEGGPGPGRGEDGGSR